MPPTSINSHLCSTFLHTSPYPASIFISIHHSSLASEKMVAGSFVDEFVSPFPPSKVWKACVVDSHITHPKVLPEVVASVEIHGDGGVGAIKKVNFTPAVKEFTFIKERIDVIDHEKHVYKYTVIEGGLIGKKLQSCSFELCFVATADGGCKFKGTAVYNTIGGEDLAEADKNAISGGFKDLAEGINKYLQANPGAYA